MKKFFPLILSIAFGISGFLYFNNSNVYNFKVEKVHIYTYENYKSKSPSPTILLNKKELINILVNTINSSNKIQDTLNLTSPNYVVDILYSKKKKDTFYLWISDNSNSGIYVNAKDTSKGYAILKDDTSKLKTLLYR
ncbi:hypothetical protein Curi_c08160 [Gottschalkia acidurici 9a]|uniref:YhfM-like domain-containing protein n=1 Tax=Gottschalkia acidurici (strain ATCC 7906 / DSM 604 / BCRC 14475 / CIP 104303 / KCTC 5404 / NCIMB 10678 / 9a) TaxID=1128398 RepID=K0AXK8_GOTA9|nr:hypothetical protein [Gottschalkia acidurici]AFS77889.1 hypothetical protein Curi_c08160 [Gottschalkia acidurici 9a]